MRLGSVRQPAQGLQAAHAALRCVAPHRRSYGYGSLARLAEANLASPSPAFRVIAQSLVYVPS